MTGCFWDHPPANSADDCVASLPMLNLKTANLVGLAYADPPSSDPSIPDSANDLGSVTLDLAHLIGIASLQEVGPATAFQNAEPNAAPITFSVPLRSVGGSFAIGATNYPRPPTLANQYLFLLVSFFFDGEFLYGAWTPEEVFGWNYGGAISPVPSDGFINCSYTILNDAGSVIQSAAWCHMQFKDAIGSTPTYGDAPGGAFPTGDNGSSYLVYQYLRFWVPITFPAEDFDNGSLLCSIAATTTSSTGVAGSPLSAWGHMTPPVAVVQLVACDSDPPLASTNWPF